MSRRYSFYQKQIRKVARACGIDYRKLKRDFRVRPYSTLAIQFREMYTLDVMLRQRRAMVKAVWAAAISESPPS